MPIDGPLTVMPGETVTYTATITDQPSDSYISRHTWQFSDGVPRRRSDSLATSVTWTAPSLAGDVTVKYSWRYVLTGTTTTGAGSEPDITVTVEAPLSFEGYFKRNGVWDPVHWRQKVFGVWRPVIVRRKIEGTWVIH